MTFTNQSILQTAIEQSAVDLHCSPADFARAEDIVVPSTADPRARRYLTLPFACCLVSYGGNVVASAGEGYRAAADELLRRFGGWQCFEHAHLLLQGAGRLDESEYFLPDLDVLHPLGCPYPLRVLGPADFAPLYTDAWANALCKARSELDMLGVGAYDSGQLVGLAACSADCDSMWQIGVDVLPGYRRQGIASALTSRLALAILERGKVPFYCAAWPNLRSVGNAIKSGFRPAWVELTVRPGALL